MSGIIFSRQLDDSALRLPVVLFSVAVPLFASGSVITRPRIGRIERFLLFLGMLMLLTGAAVTLSGLTDSLLEREMLSPEVVQISRTLGLISLMTGLLAVLYAVMRTGEDVEELADRFWHLAEHINDGFILSSATGEILLVNAKLLELFGKERDEVVGRKTTALAQEFESGAILEQFAKRPGGVASEYEIKCVIDGRDHWLWVSGSPIFDSHGNHTGTLGLVRDVSEQHKLANRLEQYNRGLKQLVEEQTQRLRQSETRFRQLLLSMNEGFLTLDNSYHIRFVNERICELLQIEKVQLVQREVFDFIDTTGRVHLLNLLAQGAGRARADLRREMNFVDRKGSLVPVVVAVSYVPGESKEEMRYSLVVTSVLELKRMQHQLEQRARELEKVNEELRMHDRAKDGFLSNVSHELRTPLSTIKGYLEMLESGGLGELDASQQSALGVMRRNVDRLVGHINEIIEFSRMEIRGVQLTMALFHIKNLVEECTASVHPAALPKDLSLNTFIEEADTPIWGDREKLAQVLNILLNNAVKFSNPGGMIHVRVEEGPDHSLAIAVSDTGIGIEPAYQEKVFSKFFQVDASRSRRYGGTGIGLSIAKSIVEAHGGHIELESRSGQGSTFTIRLPEATFDKSYNPESVQDFADLRVTLISANEPFRTLIGELLEGWGCTVSRFTQHFEGARAAAEEGAHVVILNDAAQEDVGAPTLAAIRSQPGGANLPVIVCSDRDAEALRESSSMSPDVLFLMKPFGARRLVAFLRTACFGEEPVELVKKEKGEKKASHVGLRVLVVDPDPHLLEWIEVALDYRGVACCCAPDILAGLDIAKKEPPDVVLVDVDMPEEQAGQRVTQLLEAQTTAGAQVYVMTGMPNYRPAVRGVAGVLRKPFSVNDIIKVLESLAGSAASAADS